MIDLSQHEVGQRFRTRGGDVATLLPGSALGWYWLCVSGRKIVYYLHGSPIARDARYTLDRPIYSVPARTRRLPKPSPMPTGYERQWPHLYQMGGGA